MLVSLAQLALVEPGYDPGKPNRLAGPNTMMAFVARHATTGEPREIGLSAIVAYLLHATLAANGLEPGPRDQFLGPRSKAALKRWDDTFLVGTSRQCLADLVERANMYPFDPQTMDASGAVFPCMGGCELAPTTAMRANAHSEYPRRFRPAYGHRHSFAVGSQCTFSTKFQVPRTRPTHHHGLPPTSTSHADRRIGLHYSTCSVSMASPWKANCTGPRDGSCRHEQSRFPRRFTFHSKPRSSSPWGTSTIIAPRAAVNTILCNRRAKPREEMTIC